MSSTKTPKDAKAETAFWERLRGKIYAARGGWVVGEAVYNSGYSMMDDLVGRVSYFQVLVLNVTGRLPERRLAEWMEAVFICMSWPDARIWCNQIGSLAGSLRATPVASVCAGVLASDSPMYGVTPLVAASRFIVEALRRRKQGKSVAAIVGEQRRRPGAKPVIVGYARPIATGDERIPAMERVAEKLGFAVGEHLSLAYEIEKELLARYQETMNIAGYMAAFLSDQGFTATEIYRLFSMLVNAGVHATYVEAVERPPESFFPLRCEDIDYQGTTDRPVPPAIAAT